ncbi:uncharacterized protein [Maniola hyperantus]|uniref:uncharacterized protein n=1 Tax=Aphantopus hyperantus TaxID=2795564 RepID=UPI0037498A74
MPRNYQKKTDRQSWSKTSMEKAIDASHPGRVVTHFQIGLILNKAYGRAATVQNAVNGFQKTGLWPIDPNIFPDYLFEPAETTNIPLQQDETVESPAEAEVQQPAETTHILTRQYQADKNPVAAETCTTSTTVFEEGTSAVDNPDLPSTSQAGYSATVRPSLIEDPPTSTLLEKTATVPLSQISPLPKGVYVTGQGKRKSRKKPTVLLLTSTPNMEEAKKKSAPPPISKKRTRNVTKALNFSSSSDEDFSSLQTYTSAIADEEDCPCIYCNDLFSRSKPKEVWLQCLNCKKWAHASCADVPKKTKTYLRTLHFLIYYFL